MSPCYLPDGTGKRFNSLPKQRFPGGRCDASDLTLLWCGWGKKVEKYLELCPTTDRAEVLVMGKR